MFPTHPAFELYRQERAQARDESYGTATFLANSAVEHAYGFRFNADARHAIETAPAIASEPGRMADALRLIATAFAAIPGHLVETIPALVETIPAPTYGPVCTCAQEDPRVIQGGGMCDSCWEDQQAAQIAAEERSERIYASSYGLGL